MPATAAPRARIIKEGERLSAIPAVDSLLRASKTVVQPIQQQITLSDGTNNITVTLQGQGTVNDGVLAATGQLSSTTV